MRFFYTAFFVFTVISGQAQIIRGVVRDAKTKEPLPYVHIGVFDKNRGIVSKDNGVFEFNTGGLEKTDKVTFSMLGYELYHISVTDSITPPVEILMRPKALTLKEVVINESRIVELEKLGRYEPTKTTIGRSNIKEWGIGDEWGLRIFTDNKRYLLKDVNLHIRFNTVDSILFRINIYNIKDSLPGESLLNRDIFMTGYKKQKWITKNIESEKLVIDKDVIVTMEILRVFFSDKGENQLFITYGKGYERGKTFSRESSLDQWYVQKLPPLTMYITGQKLD